MRLGEPCHRHWLERKILHVTLHLFKEVDKLRSTQQKGLPQQN